MLPPEAFAVSEGVDAPPSDLISEDTWHGIVHLPDDVALRTSSHKGRRLHLLYGLWGDWVEAIGDPDNPDQIFNCLLDAADCFQSAHFNCLSGFYRTALAELRTALELVMIGTFGQLNPTNADYVAWKRGETENFGFSRCRRKLNQLRIGQPGTFLFADDALLATTFRTLCSFTHSRPDASDGALWHSNGPVFKNEAFNLVFMTMLDAYALSHLLARMARPRQALPADSEILFELDWMPNHAVLVRGYAELFGHPPREAEEA